MSDSDDEIYLEALKEKARQILNMPKPDKVTQEKIKKPTKKEMTEEKRRETLENLRRLREDVREKKGIVVEKYVKPKRVYNKEEPKEAVKEAVKEVVKEVVKEAPKEVVKEKTIHDMYYIPRAKYNMKTFGYNI
jgi:aldehyde:ferredoxin oxidoreductase